MGALNVIAVAVVGCVLACVGTAIMATHPEHSRAVKLTVFALFTAATLWAIYRLGTNW